MTHLWPCLAVAAKYALDELGMKKVAILDWDVHHGNGVSSVECLPSVPTPIDVTRQNCT
jgi:hypothetical protein